MKEIVLEMCYDETGRYVGKKVIYEEQLTPENLKKIKKDKDWKKHRKVMKQHGYNIGEDE